MCWSPFLIKLQTITHVTLLKRQSNTGGFLWILQNLYKHLFWRAPANDSFWILLLVTAWVYTFLTLNINYWDQVNSWKNLWKTGPLCRNNLDPFSLLNIAAYWQSSNTEAFAKKLSHILLNKIDNDGRGVGLWICFRYWLRI